MGKLTHTLIPYLFVGTILVFLLTGAVVFVMRPNPQTPAHTPAPVPNSECTAVVDGICLLKYTDPENHNTCYMILPRRLAPAISCVNK